MGIINRRNNERFNELTARFGYFDAENNSDVADSLFEAVEGWAADRGMNKMVGPMGFTDQNPEGLLIEGFEHEPTIETNSNPPYLVQLVENNRYSKEVDYLTYTIPIHTPELYLRILERVKRQGNVELVEFSRRSELRPYVLPILRLMNETYQGLYGYVPMDEREMDQLARQYVPILDPRLVKVATNEGNVVGFIIAMPNLAKGFRRSGGSLFPLGLLYLRAASRSTTQLDYLLAGVHPNTRGRGMIAMMNAAMVESALKAGMTTADSHHILETNLKMRGEFERFGGIIYKRHRIFQKSLVGRTPAT